jgi:GNAT superfamily N-acetyltransferase
MNEVVARVRRGLPADREPVLELWWQLSDDGREADPRYRVPSDAEPVAHALVDGWFSPGSAHLVWVAETERIVGFVAARPAEPNPLLNRPPTMVLTDAIVGHSARRQGIGRLLVRSVREYAAQNGFGSLEVGTLAHDARAAAFWQAMGFSEWRVVLESPVHG